MTEINKIDPIHNQSSTNELDIKKLVLIVLRNWYWFFICIIIAIILAFFYNRYTTPLYKVHSSILIEDENSNGPLSGGAGKGDVFEGFSVMGSGYNLYNQMAVLKSKILVEKALDKLNFEISYYVSGDIIVTERYNDAPFRVEWDENHPQVNNADLIINILPNGNFELEIDAENVIIYDYASETIINKLPELLFKQELIEGVPIVSEYFSFTLYSTEYYNRNSNLQYKFRFNNRRSLVNQYKNGLIVENKPERSTILELSIIAENSNKGKEFLNTLANVYQSFNLNKKNVNANRTINFITEQLANVSDSLIISEDRKQNFQSENRIIDISLQTQQLLEQINELDKEKVALETKDKYYKYLREYIQSNQELENIIAPSAMGIEDPLLNSLISELNTLIVEKSSMTSVKNTEHPKLKRLNAQIESTKNNLLENTSNIISQSELALSDTRRRLRYFESMVKSLPETEREYVNIERKYSLNNEIYTFLLQKLSEAQIAKASNIPDSQIIEEAESLGIVKPRKNTSYLIALSFGIIIPLLFIFLKDFFSTKVTSDEDIKSISIFPLLGYVYNSSKGYKGRTLVLDKPNSPTAEPYRAIVNKLSFFSIGKENQVIAVTSSFSGEGKSFNAINIASIYALSKKKTLLLDLDLRRSSIAEAFDLDPNKGLVYYLLGKNKIDEIIFKSKHPNLHIIPAGPIPPNPAELLGNGLLNDLIEKLKSTYDIIIVDTSPVGAVADTIKIAKLFDTIVFVVRKNFTNIIGLRNVLNELEENGIKRLGIIFNHISLRSKKHGYGYGYGYNANTKTTKRKILKLDEEDNA